LAKVKAVDDTVAIEVEVPQIIRVASLRAENVLEGTELQSKPQEGQFDRFLLARSPREDGS
jgi:hypothetical protein